ncbi:MAG: MucBP domain-containing protein, partial [Firmicutes bacterium]|nr:MucBP domain-containing protein [Bacillota bacterium]
MSFVANAQMSQGQKTKGNFVSIFVGSFHTILLDDEGRVYTFGNGSYEGNLGRGYTDAASETTAAQVTTGWDFGANAPVQMPWIKQVSASRSVTLALDGNGDIWSWAGEGTAAQLPIELGHAQTPVINGNAHYPAKVNMPTGVKAVKIAASWYGGRFLGTDGNIYAWGYGNSSADATINATVTDGSNNLGLGASTGSTAIPMKIATDNLGGILPRFVDVDSSNYWGYGCGIALADNGAVYTWSMTNNSTTVLPGSSGRPRQVTFPDMGIGTADPIVKIQAASGFWGVLTKSGKVYTWGNNTYNGGGTAGPKLGNGTTTGAANPTPINNVLLNGNVAQTSASLLPAPIFKDISLYSWGWMALDVNNNIYVTGTNTSGRHTGYRPDTINNAAPTVSTPDQTNGFVSAYLRGLWPSDVPIGTKIMSISEGYSGSGFMDENGNCYINTTSTMSGGGTNSGATTGKTAAPWVHIQGDTTTLFTSLAVTPSENVKKYDNGTSSLTVTLSQPATQVQYVILYPNDTATYNGSATDPYGPGSGMFGAGQTYYSLSFYKIDPPYFLAGSGQKILASQNGSAMTSRYYANPAITQTMFNEAFNKKNNGKDAGTLTMQNSTTYTIANKFVDNCIVWLQSTSGTQTTRIMVPFDNAYTSTQVFVRGVANGSNVVLYGPSAVPQNQVAHGYYSGSGYGLPLSYDKTQLAYNNTDHKPPLGWDVVQPIPLTDTTLYPNLQYYTLAPNNQTAVGAVDEYGVAHRTDASKELVLDNFAFYTEANTPVIDPAKGVVNTVTFTYDKNPEYWATATYNFVDETGAPISVKHANGSFSTDPVTVTNAIPVGSAGKLSQLDPYTPPDPQNDSYAPIGYTIGTAPPGATVTHTTFPDGFNPTVLNTSPVQIYIVYKAGSKTVEESYYSVDSANARTAIANNGGVFTVKNAFENGTDVDRPIPQINGYVLTGYEVWKQPDGATTFTLDSTVNFPWTYDDPTDPYTSGYYKASDFKVTGIDANYQVRYLYKASADGKIPDDLKAQAVITWSGMSSGGTPVTFKRVVVYDLTGQTRTYNEDKATNITDPYKPDQWVFDPTAMTPAGSPSPTTVTFDHNTVKNVNFYYTSDMNNNGIPDADEYINIQYRAYGAYTTAIKTDTKVQPFLLGSTYSGVAPDITGYYPVGWVEGAYTATMTDDDIHMIDNMQESLAIAWDVPVLPNGPSMTIIYKKVSTMTIKYTATTYAGSVVIMPDQVITDLVGVDVTGQVSDPLSGNPLWIFDPVNSVIPANDRYVMQDTDTVYHLYYKENTSYRLYVKSAKSTDNKIDFQNTLRYLPNFGAVTVTADPIPNYSVKGWTVYDDNNVILDQYMAGDPIDSVTLNTVTDGNRKIEFLYAPTDTSVTIYAVDGNGQAIPEYTPISIHALYGTAFSMTAPYILGWNLDDSVTKTIASVDDTHNTITFKYSQATGNVTIIMKEDNASGRVIKTASANLTSANTAANPLTINVPDLAADYYTAVPGQTAKQLVYDGNSKTVEFYYTKMLRGVDIITYDVTNPANKVLLHTYPDAGSYRIGETAQLQAPNEANFKLVTTTPLTVIINPGTGNQQVEFDYTTLAQNDVVVKAIDRVTGYVLQTYTLQGIIGDSMTVTAPYVIGYRLEDGASSTQSVTVPGIANFYYVKDVVTVTIAMVDANNSPIAPPAGVQTKFEVAMNSDFTAYAPHIPGYVLQEGTAAFVTYLSINSDQTATFHYQPATVQAVKVLVTGTDAGTGKTLYTYTATYDRNVGDVQISAFDINGYALDASTPSPATVTIGTADMSVTFKYNSLKRTITIKAIDTSGAAIPTFTPFPVAASAGQAFSYNAPYISGYNLVGSVTQSINPVTADADMTFTYERAAGNVVITLKENDTNGVVIKTISDTLAAGASKTYTPPSLASDYYTAQPGQSELVTNNGQPMSIEFYYNKDMRLVNIVAYDTTNSATLRTLSNQGPYRVGEASSFSAPSVSDLGNYALTDPSPRLVMIAPGTTNQTVQFNYRDVSTNQLVVNAVDPNNNILQTSVLISTTGTELTVDAPSIPGWMLKAGETTPKTGTVPGTVTFGYVPNVVTVTLSLKETNSSGAVIAPPAGVPATYKAEKGYDYTIYAPHIPGYQLMPGSLASITYSQIATDKTAEFYYQKLSDGLAQILVKGTDGATGQTLYSYTKLVDKNTNNISVAAFDLSGYQLDTTVAGNVSPKIVNVGSDNVEVNFVYASLRRTITIAALDNATGLAISGFTPILVSTMANQPFSYNAPYVNGYNLNGSVTQTIANVTTDQTLTFRYDKASGNVVITLKENGPTGPVIKTYSAIQDFGTTVVYTAPDAAMAAEFYTPVTPGRTVTVTNNGQPMNVEFYYTKNTRNADVLAINQATGATIGSNMNQGPYRVGEASSFNAPYVAGNYALVDPTPRLVFVTAGAGNMQVQFNYRSLTQSQLSVLAVDANNNVLQSSVVTADENTTLTVNAPSIVGYRLADGEASSKQGTTPGTVTFSYVKNVVTVTLRLVDNKGADISGVNNSQTSFEVAKGTNYTAYAPQIQGYALDKNVPATVTYANISQDQSYTFVYAPISEIVKEYSVNVTVTGMDEVTNRILYTYSTLQPKNSGALSISALNVDGYALDSARSPSPANVTVAEANINQVFYYTSQAVTVTIRAVDTLNQPIPAYTVQQVPATLGQAFSYNAPYIPGWNIQNPDTVTQVIPSVGPANNTITFVYAQATGNVTVLWKEDNTLGRVIGSESYNIASGAGPLFVQAKNLQTQYYTLSASSPLVQQVDYKDYPQTIEFYYTKSMSTVTVNTYDITTVPAGTLIHNYLQGPYRMGEVAAFSAYPETGMALVGSATQSVLINTNPQTVSFNYRRITADQVVVEAVDSGSPAKLLSSTVIPATAGTTVTVNAPAIPGYALAQGQPLSQDVPAGNKATFVYVPNVVTVSLSLKETNSAGAVIAVPQGTPAFYTAQKGYDYTVYAPHVPGYVLMPGSLPSITYTAISTNVTAEFYYQKLSEALLQILVKGIDKDTQQTLYSYTKLADKNSIVAVTAFELGGYALDPASQSPATVNVGTANKEVTFTYSSLRRTITIAAVDNATGAAVDGYTPILVTAMAGQAFSYNAPYVNGYNLNGALTQTIANVTTDQTLTFRYDKASGNVVITLKENGPTGPVIKTMSDTIAVGASKDYAVPDLSGDNYTAVAGQQTQTVTNRGQAMSIEFYYTKNTRMVDVLAVDGTGATIGSNMNQGPYRVGEAALFNAPYVQGNYVLADTTPRLVIVTAGTGNMQVKFAFRDITESDLIVYAVDLQNNVLQTSKLSAAKDTTLTVNAPSIPGYRLNDGESSSKAGTVPGTVTFVYVKNVVTVTLRLVDNKGADISGVNNSQTNFEVAKGTNYTAYAPQIQGYVLDNPAQSSVTYTNISQNQSYTFVYVPISEKVKEYSVNVTVAGTDEATGQVLYTYSTLQPKNSGTLTIKALAVDGYTLDAARSPSPAYVTVADSDISQVFYYASTAMTVTIRAVDTQNQPIAAYTVQQVPVTLGQAFSYNAPYIPGWDIQDPAKVTQVIASVSTSNNTMTFVYTKASGNVTILWKEDDANGRVIGSASANIAAGDPPLTITAPDLSANFYTLISARTQTVTAPGTYEFYFRKQMANVTVSSYDISVSSPGTLLHTYAQGQYRMGEAATFSAYPESGLLVVGGVTQTVLVNTNPTDVKFNYRAIAADEILIEAVDDNPVQPKILRQTTISAAIGSTVTVNAPSIPGYLLAAGQPSTQNVQAGSKATFVYTANTVTVTLSLIYSKTGGGIPVPPGTASAYKADKGYDFTVYAPHVPGYVIDGPQTLTFTAINSDKTATFHYLRVEDVIDTYSVPVTVIGQANGSNTELYRYVVNKAKGSGSYQVAALTMNGYTLSADT